MEDFEKRLVIEYKDLEEKITKLRAFMLSEKYSTLDKEEQNDLNQQLDGMIKYHNALAKRMSRRNLI
jgi:hypothetical protein